MHHCLLNETTQADATWSPDISSTAPFLTLIQEREGKQQVRRAMDMDEKDMGMNGNEVKGDVKKRCYVRSRVSD